MRKSSVRGKSTVIVSPTMSAPNAPVLKLMVYVEGTYPGYDEIVFVFTVTTALVVVVDDEVILNAAELIGFGSRVVHTEIVLLLPVVGGL